MANNQNSYTHIIQGF